MLGILWTENYDFLGRATRMPLKIYILVLRVSWRKPVFKLFFQKFPRYQFNKPHRPRMIGFLSFSDRVQCLERVLGFVLLPICIHLPNFCICCTITYWFLIGNFLKRAIHHCKFYQYKNDVYNNCDTDNFYYFFPLHKKMK